MTASLASTNTSTENAATTNQGATGGTEQNGHAAAAALLAGIFGGSPDDSGNEDTSANNAAASDTASNTKTDAKSADKKAADPVEVSKELAVVQSQQAALRRRTKAFEDESNAKTRELQARQAELDKKAKEFSDLDAMLTSPQGVVDFIAKRSGLKTEEVVVQFIDMLDGHKNGKPLRDPVMQRELKELRERITQDDQRKAEEAKASHAQRDEQNKAKARENYVRALGDCSQDETMYPTLATMSPRAVGLMALEGMLAFIADNPDVSPENLPTNSQVLEELEKHESARIAAKKAPPDAKQQAGKQSGAGTQQAKQRERVPTNDDSDSMSEADLAKIPLADRKRMAERLIAQVLNS